MIIDSYSKDIAVAATPENLVADSGTKWKFAREVIIRCPAGNTSDLLIGSVERQGMTVLKGQSQPLSTMNKAGQAGKFELDKIMVKAGTNGDDVEILLIDPSLE